MSQRTNQTHIDYVQSLCDRLLLVERVSGIHLCRDLARHNLEYLLAELHKQSIQCVVHLLINVAALLLAICNGLVNELRILWLFGRGEDQRWVGGGILWLVLLDRSKVTRVGDNDLLRPSVRSLVHMPKAERVNVVGEGQRTVPVALSWSSDEDMIKVSECWCRVCRGSL